MNQIREIVRPTTEAVIPDHPLEPPVAPVGLHYQAQARRVISGHDSLGNSTIVDDGPTVRRIATPAFTVCDVWETTELPVPMSQGTAEGEVTLLPAETGFIFRVTTFPPDREWNPDEFSQSLDGMGGAEHGVSPSMHVHPTLDIVTVVAGEIYVVFEKAETLLRQGDTVIVRGAMHAWSNRSTEPCTVTSLMMGAHR